MEASSVTSLLYSNLTYRSKKQQIIASNIANLNTPKYKTKDVKFNDFLQNSNKKQDLPLKTTNSKHFSNFIKDSHKEKYQVFEVKGLEEQNDGNNVNLDREITKMTQNKVLFDAINNSIRKDISWFKLVVDSSGKN